MARGELFPILNVPDMAKAAAFYSEVFDGEVSYAFPDDAEPVYLTLTIGASTLGIGLGTSSAMYGEVPLPATGHAVDLCVYVPDLDAVAASASLWGGAVAVEPTDTPWGERVAYLRDPFGTMLLVIQDD